MFSRPVRVWSLAIGAMGQGVISTIELASTLKGLNAIIVGKESLLTEVSLCTRALAIKGMVHKS